MTGAFENRVYPDPDQLAAMQEKGPGGPIVMVDLLKVRDRAEYPDGRATALSGREARMICGRDVSGRVEKRGGRVIHVGDVSFLALGQAEPMWDEVALALYPPRKALFEMSTSPEWMAIAPHLQAGLAGQLNIETTPTFMART